MKAIADTCVESMPRRPSTFHRKAAYWWNEKLAGLRNECNKRRRDFQKARKANRPNAIVEQEIYKNAIRMLRIVIRKCKTESWKNLIETINSDPWGLPYKIVIDKLQRSQGSSVPEDKESMRKIVEVLFPAGEPRTSFPNQEHREAGEPFSPQELKAAASRLFSGKSPKLDGIPNEVVRLIAKNRQKSVFNKCLEEGIFPDR